MAKAVPTTVLLVLGACLLIVSASSARGHAVRSGARRSSGLIYSTASSATVQRQPAPDSCRALGFGSYSRPDPRCTPGALDPAVTQADLASTICKPGWTETVRPPEYITESEKRRSLAAYGDRRSLGDYEYDHFVPLELGGATNDPRNLWPEPGASPNPKDGVENYLNRQVCEGRMQLAAAQRAIVANWVTIYRRLNRTSASRAPAPSPNRAAACSASAQWSSRYDDYDVYVKSSLADQSVIVTGAGATKSWHTNGSGYADVYLDAARSAAGDRVRVTVGGATCYAIL